METIRQQMIALLIDKEMDARELSQTMGIREKEVYEHLPHIARSVAVQKKKLFTPPGRCPRCKKSHLDQPKYRIS
jgi:predicted Zn-ribbon and HTH transcriptional regulator